jgi:hypothetical protein
MKKLRIEILFPLIVLVLSAVKLLDVFYGGIQISVLIVSLIGIGGVVLYFTKIKYYRQLIYIWILAQLIVINKQVLDPASNTWIKTPVWNTTQTFDLTLSLSFKYPDRITEPGVNVLAIIFFGFLKIVEVSSLVGKKFTFEKFDYNDRLGDVFPLLGTAIRRIKLGGKKDFLLIQLDFPFQFRDLEIAHIIIKERTGRVIRPGEKQTVEVRIVKDVNEITEDDNDIKKFPMIDFAYCQ